MEDLRREQFTWRHQREKFESDLDDLAKDEERRKAEYYVATTDVQKRRIARGIQDIQTQSHNLEAKIGHCSKMLKVTNGFLIIKENEAFYAQSGVLTTLNGMDSSEVATMIDKLTVDIEMRGDQLEMMNAALQDGMRQLGKMSTEEGLDDLMATLDAERATQSTSSQPQGGQSVSTGELDRMMADLNAQAQTGAAATREAIHRTPPSVSNHKSSFLEDDTKSAGNCDGVRF